MNINNIASTLSHETTECQTITDLVHKLETKRTPNQVQNPVLKRGNPIQCRFTPQYFAVIAPIVIFFAYFLSNLTKNIY